MDTTAFLLIFIAPLSILLLWLCYQQALLLKNPVRRVIANVTQINEYGGEFEAIYSFSEGQISVDIRDRIGEKPLPFAIGDEIELFYPQGHPQLAQPKHRWLVFEISFVALLLGLMSATYLLA